MSGVVGAGEGDSEDDPPLAKNETVKLYWKWFASTRTVFESKVRRAEYMQFADRLGL